jgi:hypothetical protein
MDDFPSDKKSAKRQAIKRATKAKALKPTSSLLEDYPHLTEKQVAYVENRAFGLNKGDSARAAGYKDAPGEAKVLEQLPAISEAMAAERAKNARYAGVTREDVIEGIKTAIDQAISLAEPMAQIAGWREIAKICGHYAPEVRELRLTGPQEAKMKELQTLSDEQLLELAGNVIEGESQRVDH